MKTKFCTLSLALLFAAGLSACKSHNNNSSSDSAATRNDTASGMHVTPDASRSDTLNKDTTHTDTAKRPG
ncbi:MAG: hypothetical protein ACTHMI_10800 [Mucilaginibacter sp.]|jgi:hypothetical protein